jgi:hypothetical protein
MPSETAFWFDEGVHPAGDPQLRTWVCRVFKPSRASSGAVKLLKML